MQRAIWSRKRKHPNNAFVLRMDRILAIRQHGHMATANFATGPKGSQKEARRNLNHDVDVDDAHMETVFHAESIPTPCDPTIHSAASKKDESQFRFACERYR